MSYTNFIVVVFGIEEAIRREISKIGKVPYWAQKKAEEYKKPCYYNFISKRIHDSETHEKIT